MIVHSLFLKLKDRSGENIAKTRKILLSMSGKIEQMRALKVETDILQARDAGPAIVDEAVERGADIILMGFSYKRRFGQYSLGHVVPFVLKNSPCPVILYQQ